MQHIQRIQQTYLKKYLKYKNKCHVLEKNNKIYQIGGTITFFTSDIVNERPISCSLCMDSINDIGTPSADKTSFIRLGCGCYYHSLCFSKLIFYSVNDSKTSIVKRRGIKCPNWQSHVGETDYYFTTEDLDNFMEKLTEEFENFFHHDFLTDTICENFKKFTHGGASLRSINNWIERIGGPDAITPGKFKAYFDSLKEGDGTTMYDIIDAFEFLDLSVPDISSQYDGLVMEWLRTIKFQLTELKYREFLSTNHLEKYFIDKCLERIQLARKDMLTDIFSDPYIAITSKKCPLCMSHLTHYQGHQCHHITCPNIACLTPDGNRTKLCYRCLETDYTNLMRRGNASTCRCGFSHSFCSNALVGTNVQDILNISGEYPMDKKCKCVICPDCRVGRPCHFCFGDCAVCKGICPHGPLNLEDVPTWKRNALKSKQKMNVRLPKDTRGRPVINDVPYEYYGEIDDEDYRRELREVKKEEDAVETQKHARQIAERLDEAYDDEDTRYYDDDYDEESYQLEDRLKNISKK